MSRWGRGRGGSVAVPLDSALFRENSNCPTAARSAGTVGKWGITSFTSIRSAPYGNYIYLIRLFSNIYSSIWHNSIFLKLMVFLVCISKFSQQGLEVKGVNIYFNSFAKPNEWFSEFLHFN